jgi:hypothetical protein
VSLGECDGHEGTDGAGVVNIFLYSESNAEAGLLYFRSSREAMVRVGVGSDGDQKGTRRTRPQFCAIGPRCSHG